MYCGRVKWFHRSDLAREPLCREPWYRQKSSDSTHHCLSPTPKLNAEWFTSRTQFSEQDHSYLTASKRHQSTPCSHNTHRTFHEKPGNILSRGRQNMSILLWHAPRISRKFAGMEICSVVLRPQRKPHLVSFSFGSIIFVASWHTLFLGD